MKSDSKTMLELLVCVAGSLNGSVPPHRQLLFAALTPSLERRRLLPDCPEESPIVSNGNQPVKWRLHNTARVPLQLLWVSFEGNEQKMEKVGPGERTTVETCELSVS